MVGSPVGEVTTVEERGARAAFCRRMMSASPSITAFCGSTGFGNGGGFGIFGVLALKHISSAFLN